MNEGRRSVILGDGGAAVRRSVVLDGGIGGGVVLQDPFAGRRSVVLGQAQPISYVPAAPMVWTQPRTIIKPVYIIAGQQQTTTVTDEELQNQLRLKTEECEQWRLKYLQIENQKRSGSGTSISLDLSMRKKSQSIAMKLRD